MTDIFIEGVINQALQELMSDETGIDLVFPNISYTPSHDRPYLMTSCIPTSSTAASLGTDAPNRRIGFYQVDINLPADTGTGEALRLLKKLNERFKRGTWLRSGDVAVRITAFREAGVQFEQTDWYRRIGRIFYRADLEN